MVVPATAVHNNLKAYKLLYRQPLSQQLATFNLSQSLDVKGAAKVKHTKSSMIENYTFTPLPYIYCNDETT